MPSHTKSKLQTVLEESSSAAVKHPSVTTAVKSLASVLLGPRGKTPLDSMLSMQHYQLWGFILIVVGIIYIVWLMQKKLDSIEKQYKEQFVLLHRLFKSHQDLQVEVRRKSVQNSHVSATNSNVHSNTHVNTHVNNPANNTVTEQTGPSLDMEDEDDIRFDETEQDDAEDEQDDAEDEHDDVEDEHDDAEDEEDDVEDEQDDAEDEQDAEEPELDYEEYE
jgi:FtsZ-interacting cell division protein ZipA